MDGESIARILHAELPGRIVKVPTTSGLMPSTISLYFDQAVSTGVDWRKQLTEELARSHALIAVCTPSALVEAGEDWYYYELRWWLDNRGLVPPILLTPSDGKAIPRIILDRWPHIQWVQMDINRREAIECCVQSILSGLQSIVEGGDVRHDLGTTDISGLYMWEKDRRSRYTWCNENYARAADFDSPTAMQDKTDDDMPWRALAEFFRSGDRRVIAGIGPPRFHVREKEIMVDKVADILVTEQRLLDHRRECIGVQGFFIDTTGILLPHIEPVETNGSSFCLGEAFGNECLSDEEVAILRQMLLAHKRDEIAIVLRRGRAEVDRHIESIKRKLQCTTDSDVITIAIRSALTLRLFSIDTSPSD